MTADAHAKPSPKVPRWLVRAIWLAHRRLYALTGGRFGLRAPAKGRWGMLRLRTTGRRSGRERIAILGYIEDGRNILVPAMNGWADANGRSAATRSPTSTCSVCTGASSIR